MPNKNTIKIYLNIGSLNENTTNRTKQSSQDKTKKLALLRNISGILLKQEPSLIVSGRPREFNVIQNQITNSMLLTIKPGTTVVLVFDTDKEITDKLKRSIELIRKIRKIITSILIALCLISFCLSIILAPDEPVHFKGLDYSISRHTFGCFTA